MSRPLGFMVWIDWVLDGAFFLFAVVYLVRVLLQVRAMKQRSADYCARLDAVRQRLAASGGRDAEAERELILLLRRPPGLQ